MQRKIVSLVSFFSFLGMVVSSLILYCQPEGRVAYWANWEFLGFSKTEWTSLHITGGMLFLVAGVWHLVLNWKPLVNYMKQKAAAQAATPLPLLVSLGITLFVYAGTLFALPPMAQIMAWNADIKVYHSNTYGNPPFAHAELSSLEQFCSFLQIDGDVAVAYLQQQNLKGAISKQTSILDIAKANGVAPQAIYKRIQNAVASDDPFSVLPPAPPEGTGKLTLEALCSQYSIPFAEVEKKLQAKNIAATPADTLHALAKSAGMTPKELYLFIREPAGK